MPAPLGGPDGSETQSTQFFVILEFTLEIKMSEQVKCVTSEQYSVLNKVMVEDPTAVRT